MQYTPADAQPMLGAQTEAVFEQVFKTYFRSLHAYACTILKDEATAEEMVQNVFYKMWEKKEQISVQQSVQAYLYKAVYHECLNYLKHTKVRAVHKSYTLHHSSEAEHTGDRATMRELEGRLDEALKKLPEQCRAIFQLSRFEELKYKEIAERLGISIKTVENQMGKALRIMRQELSEYLPAILIILLLNL
ncbi:MAG: RNA polymerase sigma-70 factor [Sphingobacteriales bacterium]|nr:MAG: RNA polymerase sigma-70 factor [Sphingobacteriales bacterium]